MDMNSDLAFGLGLTLLFVFVFMWFDIIRAKRQIAMIEKRLNGSHNNEK